MKSRTQDGGYLLLEDGTKFQGDSYFGDSPALGEAVFNTSHTGYQEIISDPSYYHQLITFTAPHIGNVGTNAEDCESSQHRAAGLIVRSLSPRARNWRSEEELTGWLESEHIPLLSGANTRGITLHIRQRGAMRAGLFPVEIDTRQALDQVLASPSMAGADLAREVTASSSREFDIDTINRKWHRISERGKGLSVAVLDFGVKVNILRELVDRGCQVMVLPATTAAEEIISLAPDGIMLSNGPGDPASVDYGIATVRKLLEWGKPMFGICLGHQILSLAAGGRTFKLPFGHRGANHPVRREADGVIEITNQNHGFAVEPAGFPDEWQITHMNLNDHTVEGLRHREHPFFSIQYHPEASPGPHESLTYFDQFIEDMRRAKA